MYVPIHQVPTQVCSTVDERKTRRYEDIKMTQRRHKPIATKRRKANGAPKKTVRWNEGCDDSKTWHQRHEDNRQWLEEQFSKRRSVSKATKSEYRFCPRSDAKNICPLMRTTVDLQFISKRKSSRIHVGVEVLFPHVNIFKDTHAHYNRKIYKSPVA